MNKIPLYGLLIAILFLISGCITGGVIDSSQQDIIGETQKTCKDIQVPYDYLEEYQETVPYTDRECEDKLLSYSITDFTFVSSVCNEDTKECKSGALGIPYDCIHYCIDRVVTCYLTLNNLDSEKGTWIINFLFYKIGGSSPDITADISRFLYPQTSEKIIGTGEIKNKELYEQEYTCSYNVPNEATKQICRDVIKYKEVTKTRTVTRYRTEQKCE